MAYKVGMFMNLKKDDIQKALRRAAFQDGLLSVNAKKLAGTQFVVRHADGDFVNDGKAYDTRVNDLMGSDLYFASCRPTLKSVLRALGGTNKPTVVGGMSYGGVWTGLDTYFKGVNGFISYDISVVFQWLTLLQGVFTAINKNCSQIAVITDSRWKDAENPAAREIYTAITNNTKIGVQPPIEIDQGLSNVKSKLDKFKKSYADGGIIVPAGTMTAIARQDIIDYINSKLLLPVIYPNQIYANAGGLISIGVDLTALYHEAGKVAGNLLLNQPGSDLDLWRGPTPTPVGYKIFQTVLNINTAKNYGYSVPMIADLALLADVVVGDDG